MVRHRRAHWACVDCGQTINDESIVRTSRWDPRTYVEFCDGCNNRDPEVVIKYA